MSKKRKLELWEAHVGEDYAVVMALGEMTENATIRVNSNDPKMAHRIARELNSHSRLLKSLKQMAAMAMHSPLNAGHGFDQSAIDKAHRVIAEAEGRS